MRIILKGITYDKLKGLMKTYPEGTFFFSTPFGDNIACFGTMYSIKTEIRRRWPEAKGVIEIEYLEVHG